jgi:hypothetical protein
VAVDGSSGVYDDDREQAGDSKPERRRGHGGHDAAGPLNTQPGEVRSRAEYYEELRGADKPMVAADGYSDRSAPDSVHVAAERAKHILDGDRWGGGHRHGTGRPGKTEFPSGWDDEKIIGHVLAVARAPDDLPVFQANRRWRVHGHCDEVGITVIIQPDGRIWSAWPDADSPGVVKNPRETT